MIYFTTAEIEQWLREDAPYHDETTRALGIAGQHGWLEVRARETPSIICGTEELVRMAALLGLTVVISQPSGYCAHKGDLVMRLTGTAGALHHWWKVAVVLLSHLSGVASATRRVVDAICAVNPHIHLATTRKVPPGQRKLMVKAVLTGGGVIHRLGLSESVLVFAQHRAFLPADLSLAALVNRLRQASTEKRIMLEAETEDEAIALAQAGADVVQCDKLSPSVLKRLVPVLKAINPPIVVSAAGGITPHNAAEFAATGVDLLITSSVYHAPPVDFGVTMGVV
ncbi:MAG: ModD protein [Halothiobacillus sp. 24-54-40]|jgi:molybdenum transport protein|nr:MAG: ModD protein [Halothiobacillus sp. 24-54-40]HQS02614.1 ModD protein [Halothiobacillus sp.]HQS28454.1 ModD protein [Halothiobacillus sp.]